MDEPIDAKDVRIISLLEANARMSATSIGKRLKIPRPTVQLRIKKMTEFGIIRRFFARINSDMLGDHVVELLLKLRRGDERTRISGEIANLPRVLCSFATRGEWDIYAGIAFNSVEELRDSINIICEMFEDEIIQKDMIHAISINPYKSDFVKDINNISGSEDIALDGGKRRKSRTRLTQNEADALEILRKNARIPTVELAEKMGVVPETAAKLIKSLLSKKVVSSYTILYDPKAIGYEKYMCLLSTGIISKKQSAEFAKFAGDHKNITYMIQGIGAYDYVIDICAKNQYELGEILTEINRSLGGKVTRQDVLFVENAEFGSSILNGKPERIYPINESSAKPAERKSARTSYS